jgi:putative NADH-flavin reductase
MTTIVVFGAGGRAGRRVIEEAGRRGLEATAVVRDPHRHPEVAGAVAGDATSAELVERVAKGHDVAISAVYSADLDPARYAGAMRELLTGLERAGVRRLLLISIGTALAGADGVRAFERPDFPAEWRPFSQARADELAVLERYTGPVDWVVFAPSTVLTEEEQEGTLSYHGLAAALLDEVMQERHHRAQLGM